MCARGCCLFGGQAELGLTVCVFSLTYKFVCALLPTTLPSFTTPPSFSPNKRRPCAQGCCQGGGHLPY